MTKNEQICLELVKAESEQEVIQILKKHFLKRHLQNKQILDYKSLELILMVKKI